MLSVLSCWAPAPALLLYCSAVYIKLQSRAVHSSALQLIDETKGVVKCSEVQRSAVYCAAVQCVLSSSVIGAVKYSALQCNFVQCSSAEQCLAP